MSYNSRRRDRSRHRLSTDSSTSSTPFQSPISSSNSGFNFTPSNGISSSNNNEIVNIPGRLPLSPWVTTDPANLIPRTGTGTGTGPGQIFHFGQTNNNNNRSGYLTSTTSSYIPIGVEKYHCIEYDWTISEFRNFLANPDTNFSMQSVLFDGNGISKCKWGLILKPKHMAEDRESWIAINLHQFSSSGDLLIQFNSQNPFVEANYELSLEIDGQLIGAKNTHMFASQADRVWNKLCKTPSQIQNDKIVIHCKVWIGCAHICHENFTPKVGPGQNLEKIHGNFASILKSGKLSDAQIEVGFDIFKVHKAILAGKSEYFLDYFEASESNSKIKVQDFSKEVVESMIEYIYTGKTQIIEGNMKELYQIGNKYVLEDLKNDCESELVKLIKVGNCIKILQFSDSEGASQVKSKCIEFIIRNKSEVSLSSDFQEMLDSNHKLCRDILKSDYVGVGSSKRLKIFHSSS